MNVARPVLTSVLLAGFAFLALGTSKPKDKDAVKVTPASATAKSDESAAAEKEKAKPEAAPRTAKVGDKIDFEDATWIVTEVKDMGQKLTARFIKPATTEGRFVRVTLKLTSHAKKEMRVTELPKIIDGQGREFGNYDKQWSYLPRDLNRSFEALQPDVTKDLGAIYELPANATKLRLVVTQLDWPRTAKVEVDLGM